MIINLISNFSRLYLLILASILLYQFLSRIAALLMIPNRLVLYRRKIFCPAQPGQAKTFHAGPLDKQDFQLLSIPIELPCQLPIVGIYSTKEFLSEILEIMIGGPLNSIAAIRRKEVSLLGESKECIVSGQC